MASVRIFNVLSSVSSCPQWEGWSELASPLLIKVEARAFPTPELGGYSLGRRPASTLLPPG